ncbi:hypothetical protein [Streptomyces johnsoniae]|uniref:Uncharacterized protein n=1 Tax=Streptomyces johnsoniae TaxID=3075532 RepID=A0ABU2S4J7_9ACTN|nr:hypothetical protein [Streptomyces sp. DSM 41886]MDT0443611.1 hypothetical protein [Streptomyces sp. DSM 41886]
MDPVVLAAGTALVGAMVTDTWQQARIAAMAWWRRTRPAQADAVETALDADRAALLAAREQGDQDTEQALIGAWRLRLQGLLAEDPALLEELRLLESRIRALLPAAGQGSVHIVGHARDNAQVFIANGPLRVDRS